MNILLLALTLNYVVCDNRFYDESGMKNFTQLATHYGHAAEKYEVVTEDGYILTVFRLPGRKRPPVLLMHGITSSSDDWLLRGNASLSIALADCGYDVWLGNVRGNRYGRRHVTLNPDKDDEFWDFSFYEYAYYDLAGIIDVILAATGQERLSAIGHSQGNTIFYVLGSTRPEYNDKISVMIALAPICYLNNLPSPLALLIKAEPQLNTILGKKDENELFGDEMPATKAIRALCTKPPIVSYAPCVKGIIFPINGYDPYEIEADFYNNEIFYHFPGGTSRKNLVHFAQVSRRQSFSNFDYGPAKNLQIYGTDLPPTFNLTRVTMPVVLLVGLNDKLSTVPDVAILRQQLPNVRNYTLINYRLMNHIDFLWGEHVHHYLFPLVFNALEYNNEHKWNRAD